MATIATQPQVGYRPGPRWMALFLVAAAGIGAGTVALVQTMSSEGVTAGRTAAVSSVDGATQTRALNQPEVAIPALPSFNLKEWLAVTRAYGDRLRGLAGDTDALAGLNRALAGASSVTPASVSEAVAVQDLRALNETQAAASPFAQGIIDARALNERRRLPGSLKLAGIADGRR
ncbi:MAG TPA: hypothetical protein VMT79_08260 [Candidatus Binatia bacterium]|nr:hypothetical protein [Candidatus Binatia bacterium]